MSLSLDLPENTVRRAIFDRTTRTPRGFILTGALENVPASQVTIVVNDGVVAGSVLTPFEAYAMWPAGPGMVSLTRIDRAEFPPLDQPVGSSAPLRKADRNSGVQRTEEDTSTIDLAAFWTRKVRAAEGGTDKVRALIDAGVANVNAALERSGASVRFQLVAAVELDYEETGDSHLDLARFSRPADGHMDEVPAIAASYAADVSYLFVTEGTVSGTASGELGLVYWWSVLSLVFPHELGHNLGLQHDRFTEIRAGGEPTGYDHGYVNQVPFEAGGDTTRGWLTVMAYSGQCGNANVHCPWLPYFSNPENVYPDDDGDPMGIPGDAGVGVDGPADGVRAIEERKAEVASRRLARTRCSYSISSTEHAFDPADGAVVVPAEAGRVQLSVDTPAGCSWSPRALDDFLSIDDDSRRQGQGAVAVEFSEAREFARTGAVYLEGEVVLIRQQGSETPVAVCGRTPAIREAIVSATGRSDCASVTPFDLVGVSYLEVVRQDTGISRGDFDGMALTRLELRSNDISDLAPLANLRDLEYLDLQFNSISDLEPLSKLVKLQALWLAGNEITDITPLTTLTGLKGIGLGANPIGDYSPVAQLTGLTQLQINSGRISDLRPLAGLKSVEWLELSYNDISDISPLAGMTALRHVDIGNNRVSDLSPLSDLEALESLSVGDNLISDLGPLSMLSEAFFNLTAPNNAISDLSPLRTLDGLASIWLNDNEISDISALANQTRRLVQGGEGPPSGWLSSPTISLSGNKIADLSPLAELNQLYLLYLNDNEISDTSPLAGLDLVSTLDLRNNKVSNLEPLKGMTRMDKLLLSGNRIEGLPNGLFYGLTNLAEVNLADNPGAPFPLHVGLTRVDDAPVAAGPASVSAAVDEGAPFDIVADLEISGGQGGAGPTTARALIRAGGTSGAAVTVRSSTGPVTVSIDNATGGLDEQCGSNFNPRPCFAGLQTAAGEPLLLFGIPDQTLEGDRILLDLPSLFDGPDASYSAVSARSSDPSLVTVSIMEGTLIIAPAGRESGEAVITVTATGDGDTERTARFSVRVIAETPDALRVLLLPAASHPGRTGVVRVINRSNTGGEVSIRAMDDMGTAREPVTLFLNAGQAVHFNSSDLEQGNDDKGLVDGIGSGEGGDWRLEFESSLNVEALSYIRTDDGFLSAMHDAVPTTIDGHHVALFNPASNSTQKSYLRLINLGSEVAEVEIRGVDDAGALSGKARVTIPAQGAKLLSAWDLEMGAEGVSGTIGDGHGKWRLRITSAEPIAVMSLMESPGSRLTNLSTAPTRQGQ